eukprot:gnl/TRDRNA2_/TRDRNA2_170406_c0_seq1.p1 gnl/TRDRNA2_/TRDRNA2_170406_c0~~gnl/TRDRNA2_/TRDRNA2_170406_c0_seq1.p1  ORF type:complete len:353 (+),score=62.46 gnl/TRDRNA2_/TRDRNA2_170406_c0_seq1:125-1183(+)
MQESSCSICKTWPVVSIAAGLLAPLVVFRCLALSSSSPVKEITSLAAESANHKQHLTHKLVEELFDRALKSASVHPADTERAALAKRPGALASTAAIVRMKPSSNTAVGRPPAARALSAAAAAPEGPGARKGRETICDYDAIAKEFDIGNANHDVSQNLDALLKPLLQRQQQSSDRTAPAPLDILDLGCAGGRDLVELARRGHRPVGLEGSAAFCKLAESKVANLEPSIEVWQANLCDMVLPPARFDGVFANAVLFHVPSECLDAALAEIFATLRPGGVFFSSNAHGFGEDKEGWTQGRTAETRSWVCWLSEASWCQRCEAAGFVMLDLYYRPPGRPREQQPFLATVWAKPE